MERSRHSRRCCSPSSISSMVGGGAAAHAATAPAHRSAQTHVGAWRASILASSLTRSAPWTSRSTRSGPRSRPPYPRVKKWTRVEGLRAMIRSSSAMAMGVLPAPPTTAAPTQTTGMGARRAAGCITSKARVAARYTWLSGKSESLNQPRRSQKIGVDMSAMHQLADGLFIYASYKSGVRRLFLLRPRIVLGESEIVV
eukprot:scaffold15277_cov129-Isochrysis_galbana.AAC.6